MSDETSDEHVFSITRHAAIRARSKEEALKKAKKMMLNPEGLHVA